MMLVFVDLFKIYEYIYFFKRKTMEHILTKDEHKRFLEEVEKLKMQKNEEAKHGFVTKEEADHYIKGLMDSLLILRKLK